jgi:hypothetical protein
MSRRRPRKGREPAERPWRAVGLALVLVAVVVAVFVLIRQASTPAAPSHVSSAQTSDVIGTLEAIPAADLESVGVGSAAVTIEAISAPPLTGPTGKPEVLCGGRVLPILRRPTLVDDRRPVEVWGLSGLRAVTSSATDVYPNTPTFTFHQASYTSPHVDFVPVEHFGRTPEGSGYNVLTPLTTEQQSLLDMYDAAPYTSSPGSIPFVFFAGKFVLIGGTYQPDVLQGRSLTQVGQALGNPSTTEARAILGSANEITAAICAATGQQPASVCQAPGVLSLERRISARTAS